MPRPKVYTSRRWMHKRYVVDKLTETEIAELAGTNQSTINRWLKKLGLKR
jgi:DNA-binding MurR/RpiR family transcriptional regulator